MRRKINTHRPTSETSAGNNQAHQPQEDLVSSHPKLQRQEELLKKYSEISQMSVWSQMSLWELGLQLPSRSESPGHVH